MSNHTRDNNGSTHTHTSRGGISLPTLQEDDQEEDRMNDPPTPPSLPSELDVESIDSTSERDEVLPGAQSSLSSHSSSLLTPNPSTFRSYTLPLKDKSGGSSSIPSDSSGSLIGGASNVTKGDNNSDRGGRRSSFVNRLQPKSAMASFGTNNRGGGGSQRWGGRSSQTGKIVTLQQGLAKQQERGKASMLTNSTLSSGSTISRGLTRFGSPQSSLASPTASNTFVSTRQLRPGQMTYNVQIFRGYSIGKWALVMEEGFDDEAVNEPVGGPKARKNRRSTITGSFSRRSLLAAADIAMAASAVSAPDELGENPESSNLTPASTSAHCLVNKHGFPQGEGKLTSEKMGPYIYVLCKVAKVHYEENEPYWTVTREDSGKDMRGDARRMKPINTEQGLLAAQKAAAISRAVLEGGSSVLDADGGQNGQDKETKRKRGPMACFMCCCVGLCYPVMYTLGFLRKINESKAYQNFLKHTKMFLDGSRPYMITFRITTVNIIVMCSFWYLLIDQIQLRFLPPSSDLTLAWINFLVWLILVLELFFESFARPKGWHKLVRSDKAYTPETARYMNQIHCFVESVSLALFAPTFWCVFDRLYSERTCSHRVPLSFLQASLNSVLGFTVTEAFLGRLYYGLVRLRVFCLVRHFRNWWLNQTFLKEKKLNEKRRRREERRRYYHDQRYSSDERSSTDTLDTTRESDESGHIVPYGETDNFNHQRHQYSQKEQEEKEREEAKIKASNIGTALMTINSHRASFLCCFLAAVFPMLFLFDIQEVVNPVGDQMVDYLQAINEQDINSTSGDECDYLFDSMKAFSRAMVPHLESQFEDELPQRVLVSVAVRPPRCYEKFKGVDIGRLNFSVGPDCPAWSWPNQRYTGACIYGIDKNISDGTTTLSDVANDLSLRIGSMETFTSTSDTNSTYAVSATYDFTEVVKYSSQYSAILQVLLVVIIVALLQVLRWDALNLVLGSLRNMLRIVTQYAKNPLAPVSENHHGSKRNNSLSETASFDSGDVEEDETDDQLMRAYETKQLVTAVSKIADLLRKCWGVAGSDIISTNLTYKDGDFEVFNPTVPGRNVFALFAFAAITDFDHALQNLGGDVMILINDVASVLHGEVYRWGLGDSGQCNRNLGSAFFMVFKIGSVMEVVEKLEEATRVVFSTGYGKKSSTKKNRTKRPKKRTGSMESIKQGRKVGAIVKGLTSDLHADKDVAMEAMAEAMKISLGQIPGISTFADRAVLGMLKSFAGIHRDNQLRAWSRDFRLEVPSTGSTWSVNMIFGMDAGWAVEGAVGSEYKIDATYLSPHVNMASRMMSACKQYGVTILLSQAVQELMSEPAKKKLRNLDRVTVKGSERIQNIYTYDAREKGADFFLNAVSDEQATQQVRNYEPNVWNVDPDLRAMRHHITEDFEQEFQAGMKAYYSGDWPTAIEKLEKANDIMVETAMDEGDLHDEIDNSPAERKELYRKETSDPPSMYLIEFMKSKGGVAPEDWDGWHPLFSK